MSHRTTKRRSTLLPSFALAGILALAAGAVGAVPTCESLSVIGDGTHLFADGFETGGKERWGVAPPEPVFYGSDTLEIRFELNLGGDLSGEHRVDFRARMPAGFLYQSQVVPFEFEPSSAGMTKAVGRSTTPLRRVPGYRDPLPMQSVRAAGAQLATGPVTTTLPVGGTLITTSSLFGEWTVEAFLDDDEAPCATANFEIRP